MKRLSILATGLIALGLLFTWSTNAMTYTVEGTTTKIAIPVNIIWTTIQRCEDCEEETLTEFSWSATKCEQKIDAGFDALVCSHNYSDEWPHTVTYNGKWLSFENFSLNNSNVTHIDDFTTIDDVTNIYIKNNPTLISFYSNIFSSNLGAKNIHLENNNIASFGGSIPYDVKKLYLNNNQLETIPENVREERGNYTIKLSASKKFPQDGSESNLIDLSGNPIKFIKITKINWENSSYYEYSPYTFNDYTSYQFEWFWFSGENESDLSFDYYILDDQNNPTITDETTQSSIQITDSLKPWEYSFKVCLHNDTDNCDRIRFNVNYTLDIEFTTGPTNWSIIWYMDWISFTREKTWGYPQSFISGYNYVLRKDWEEKDSWSSTNNPASYSLDTSLIDDEPNWDYTFTVDLIDTEWHTIATTWTEFTIFIDNRVFINSPMWTQHWIWENTKNVRFDWQTSTSLFKSYEYYITSSSLCSGSATIITWWTSYEANTIFNYPLENWNYLLCIDMYDSSHNKINDITINRSFNVYIPATVSITAPNSTVSDQPIQFTRNSFLPTPYAFINYTYSVKKWTEEISWGVIEDQDIKTFPLNNLHDGTYTVNVIMNHSGGSTGDTKTFTVNSSAGVYLNLTPTDWEIITWNHIKQVPVTFSWNWWWSPLISKYTYKLTNTSTSAIIDSGTKLASESLTIGSKSLPSGSYRFEVTMLDSSSLEITNSYSNFTVVIPSDLEIISPLPWLSATKDVTFSRSWFAESTEHYSYQVKKTWSETPTKYDNDTSITSFSIPHMENGEYTFTVSLLDSSNNPIKTKSRTFSIPDSQSLTLNISDWENSVTTLRSKTWIFSRWWTSENFHSYSYSVEWTTFKNENYSYAWTTGLTAWSFTLNNLPTWRYRFTVTMLDSSNSPITWKYMDFRVIIPATLKITSPADWAKITSSSTTFTRTWYSDTITRYEYKLTGQPASYTESTSFTTDLTNGNYTLTVKLYSWNSVVAQDSIDFTVSASTKPTGWWGWGGGWSSWKTHYNNNLKLSLWSDSPTTNERIKLIINIDDKYTWKVSFPKLQYYSPDTQKWIDIPVTSKDYTSYQWDEAKLWYVKFSSDDNWEKIISEFVKFSKNWYYRIYAEDKDWYDEYVETYVSTKKTTTTNANTNTSTINNNNVNSIIREYLPEIFEQTDTQEEVYVARSCKRYTITYSDSLKVYTSPNLNTNEYFISKEYFKRYIDSKNKYQSWCPTNVWWISTNYSDKSNDNSRYTAPNGKVYFITSQNGKYYSNELNKELKTPTSFNSIQELKYYIRDRNPLISMAALWPTN